MSKPTVAVLGASSDRSKFGNKSVRAHLDQGYDVYPINPKGGEIEGLSVYTRLADVPVERLSRITVYLPPAVLAGMMEEIAGKPHDELFLNPGSDDPAVIEAAQAAGLEPIQACSIVDLGVRPAAFGP